MSNTISAQVEALGDRHTPLATKTASAAHDAVDAVASKLMNTEEKMRNVAAESSQRFNDTQERARARVTTSLQTFKVATQKNPLIVAGAALVVGAIVASLFRRD